MAKKKASQIKVSVIQLKILEHFIIEESKHVEQYLVNRKMNDKEEISHFKTYPAKIEKEMKNMNRVTATTACEKFVDMQILEVLDKEVWRLRGGGINPYVLKSDLNTLKTLIKLIFEGSVENVSLSDSLSYPDAMKLLDNYYFTYNINDSLIRKVLAEKGVTVSRSFSIIDWDIKSAQRLYDIYERNYVEFGSDDANKKDVSEMMRAAINKSEEKIKNYERSHIGQLTEFCSAFLECVNDSSNSTERRLQNFEKWTIELYERFFYFSSNPRMNQFFNTDFPMEGARLILPVFNDGTDDVEKISKIKEANFNKLYYFLYDDELIEFSIIVEMVLNCNYKILDLLKKIEGFLELYDDNHLSDNFADEGNKLEKKWKNLIQINKEIYNVHLSKQLLKDIKCMYCNLSKSLVKLSEKYERDTDLEFMIEHIDRLCGRSKKEVDKHSRIKDITNNYIENNFESMLSEHYQKFEYEKLIVPILSLIHASPLALNEFLNGEWDSFELSFYNDETVKNNELLSKLIHIASINLLINPQIMTKGIVQHASMEHFSYPEHNNSLSKCHSKLDHEYYSKLLRIMQNDWYDNLTFTEFKNIEPSFLKIKLKQLYELKYMLNFLAKYEFESNISISTKLELKKNSELELYLLKISHIEDPITIILKLRSDDSKFEHIREMLSTRMQNKILFLNIDTEPSLYFIKELLEELNNVIMNPEFYNENIFQDVLNQKEELKSTLKIRLDQKLSNMELLRMVNEKPLYNICFLETNKYLLNKILEDGIESGFTKHFEKYLEECARIDK